ncbi:MAG: sigma-70 family RNA polymerase sigma factor [Myxococcales bacterium]|nr:sigma-70 family RNA polymerase sigma factor [Myxococcales bacterium]
MERFLGGDQRAFEELVLRYQRRVFNLSLRFVRVPEEAQEVTQEIFVKLFRSLGSFRGEAKFSTWLYMVAVNHCRNRLKYLNRRHYFTGESLDPMPDGEDDGPVRQYAAADPDPNDRVTAKETRQAVRRAIDQLSDDHREAIILRDLQGLSYEEIAEITGQSLGTVKSRIHRARSELAISLRPFVDAEGGT